MALTLASGLRDAIANAVDDYINGGTAATLEFQTSGDIEVATLTLGDPAFGVAFTVGATDVVRVYSTSGSVSFTVTGIEDDQET